MTPGLRRLVASLVAVVALLGSAPVASGGIVGEPVPVAANLDTP